MYVCVCSCDLNLWSISWLHTWQSVGFVIQIYAAFMWECLDFPVSIADIDPLQKIPVMHSVLHNFNCIFMNYTWCCLLQIMQGVSLCFIPLSFMFHFWGKAINVQAVWLKDEVCKLLKEKRSSVLRWVSFWNLW